MWKGKNSYQTIDSHDEEETASKASSGSGFVVVSTLDSTKWWKKKHFWLLGLAVLFLFIAVIILAVALPGKSPPQIYNHFL